MKKKLIENLYEVGFHESIVDFIVDDIYQLSGAKLAPQKLEDNLVKSHLENLIYAFQQTIKD